MGARPSPDSAKIRENPNAAEVAVPNAGITPTNDRPSLAVEQARRPHDEAREQHHQEQDDELRQHEGQHAARDQVHGQLADAGDQIKVTKRVNGGANGNGGNKP